jgi:predicted membrane channel-forming protein YqfA (hemolysin III family)
MWNWYEINLILMVCIGSVIVWAWLSYSHQNLLDAELWKPPTWLQCMFPDVSSAPKNSNCRKVINVDGWSISHIAAFFLVGLVAPSHYFAVLLFSIAFEYGEYVVGQRARWIMDPLANLSGYAVGSLLSGSIMPFIQQVIDPNWGGQKRFTMFLLLLLIGVAGVCMYLHTTKRSNLP